jgi:ribosomal protein S6--L-glutamate ligase
MRIAILSYSENGKPTRSIVEAGEARGHEMIVLNPDELVMFISDKIGHDRLFGKKNRTDLERIFANSIDAIIPRIGTNILYSSTIIDHLNLNLGIFSTQTGEGMRIASNKLLTLQKCSQQGIPTPKTVYANDPTMIDEYIEMVGGTPIVVKTLNGSKGEGVLLLDSYISAKSTLQALFKQNTNILIQEFIDSKGSDFRGIVVGERVVASYKRQAQKGDFRANIHKGATAVSVQLSQEEQDFCVKCAKTLNLHTAGIDFMKDADGNFKLAEANSNYCFVIQQVTSINIGDELIKFIEKEHENFKENKIVYPTKKDIIIRDFLKETQELTTALEKKNNELDIIMKNKNLLANFDKSKGKEISYIDNEGNQKSKLIEKASDLYSVMIEMFQLN